MVAIFAQGNNVWTRGPHPSGKVWSGSQGPYFFAGGSKEAVITAPNQLNKGTELSIGVHRWQVQCVDNYSFCDLGVVSPSHATHFNVNTRGAWGLRSTGNLYPGNTNNRTPYKIGDILTFVLNCALQTLTISINGDPATTLSNIQLPVHVAFAGHMTEGNATRVRML
jgi:hypothetical protein